MYSYITEELPETVFSAFPEIDRSRVSISGHSMGGHGALTLYLKNPGKYKSCSAFAPITNPLKAPWGQKAFKGYFGDNDWESTGAEYDATELVKEWKGGPLDLLIDVVCSFMHDSGQFLINAWQGTADNFYKQKQLLPENFINAAKDAGIMSGINIRMQPDYDHSYYTMATFADDHIQHAAKYLK